VYIYLVCLCDVCMRIFVCVRACGVCCVLCGVCCAQSVESVSFIKVIDGGMKTVTFGIHGYLQVVPSGG
jgi:hypothetical protein